MTNPTSQALPVNQATMFRCRGYVRADISDLSLTWIDRNSGLVVSEEAGFQFTKAVHEASGIKIISSVLRFIGSNESISYFLSCVVTVQNINVTSDFFISVITRTCEFHTI